MVRIFFSEVVVAGVFTVVVVLDVVSAGVVEDDVAVVLVVVGVELTISRSTTPGLGFPV